MSLPKPLSNLDWVVSAASSNPARPVLQGVLIEELPDQSSVIVATDGRILFVAPNDTNLKAGLYHSKTFAKIDGTFPNYHSIESKEDKPVAGLDYEGYSKTLAFCNAAIAGQRSYGGEGHFLVTFKINGGMAAFNPTLFKKMLRGAVVTIGTKRGTERIVPAIVVSMEGSLVPARFTMADRHALIMPIRILEAQWGHFDLTSHFKYAQTIEDKTEKQRQQEIGGG